ncbi:MAG: glycosyltransferase [Ktedonobacteraceae bacterium]
MSLWYFFYPKRLSFSPLDYEVGLGGCEGSLVVLTQALVSAGHDVEVFNCCYKPGKYQGVVWRMAWEIDNAPPPDILVSVRFEESIRPDLQAKQRLYWMLDDRNRGALAFLRLFENSGGIVVVASKAMSNILFADHRVRESSVIEIPLPVYTCYPLTSGRSLSCLYCSVPNRGLDVLLALWPSITSQVPSARLWVTGGYQLWGYTNEEAEDRSKTFLGNWEKVEGVTNFGVIPKKKLTQLQASCAFMLYPCRFPEMFCLAAAECTAVGTPIIASAKEALKERVIHGKNGYLIEGDIDSYATQTRFVQEVINLLHDNKTRESMSYEAQKMARAFVPEIVAAQWEQLVS